MVAQIAFASPFEVLTKPCTLKPRGRKAPELGPVVRIAAVRASPAIDAALLQPLMNTKGLRDRDGDRLTELDSLPSHMWRGEAASGQNLEFELAEARPLDCIQVWNYNAPWQTADGLRKADIAVSMDGVSWKTVAAAVEFAEAEGTDDYDEPTVVKLGGVTAQRVRFENLVSFSASGKIGLGKVVFHAPPAAAQ